MSDAVHEPGTPFADAVDTVRRGEADLDEAVAGLVGQLTDAELLWLLDGDETPVRSAVRMARDGYNHAPFEAGRLDRLGIPGIRFSDGPRGVTMGSSTAFPVALARAATFDPDLERTVGDAIGAEIRAQGGNLFAGICVNLAPFPGWGRSQESYGEDPLLLGAMGAAMADGVRPWVMACVKHYALNSMEEARFSVDVRAGDDVLHEVYLPHFRRVVEAGADAVMSSYNSVNGTWAGENPALLDEVLRGRWAFSGFVMTDFVWGLRHPVESVAAGQDLEMPWRQQRAATLPAALADGRLARADVVRAASRLLRAQLSLALRARPAPSPTVVATDTHRRLARTVATRSCVLLRNEAVEDSPVLPLEASTLGRVAVVGRLADRGNQGDVGSSRVRPPSVVTILDGLRERLAERVVTPASDDAGDPGVAAELAAGADVAVVVVGLSARDEGEYLSAFDHADAVRLLGGLLGHRPVARAVAGLASLAGRVGISAPGGDRRDLRLHAGDVALVRAVAAAQPRTVVVVVGGGTVVLDPWDGEVPAVLMAWYPGMEGGRAVADVLLGDAEPAGRLPLAIPRRAADLPTVDWRSRTVDYPRWWGQRHLDRSGTPAAYPFGFGLGYTTIAPTGVVVGEVAGEDFTATVTVANTGERDGRHVLQVYATRLGGTPGVRVLVGFRAVDVAAGGQLTVPVACSVRPLQRWDGAGLVTDPGEVLVEAASWSGDPDAVTATLVLPAQVRR